MVIILIIIITTITTTTMAVITPILIIIKNAVPVQQNIKVNFSQVVLVCKI